MIAEPEADVLKTQIYSLKVPEDAALCASLGVDFIGVATGERGRLKPEVSFAVCREIFAAIPSESDSLKNALTVAWDVEEIVEIVEATRPDVIHLSGDIYKMSPEQVGELRRAISPVKIMQAIPVGGPESLRLAFAYQAVSDIFILDTDVSNIVGIGATGAVHDWSISAEIARRVHIPVILAGGLSAANVAEAMRIVKPWGVDSFTHTNIPGTKRKDPVSLAAFVQAAHAAR